MGLEDVSELGALRAELERRELDARAIFGENVLRVLSALGHLRDVEGLLQQPVPRTLDELRRRS